jgi:hypothetical protein
MDKPTIRILHNLARSGGTLVGKCLGSMKSVVLLSEIHPLGTQFFNPLAQAQEWHNLLTPEDIRKIERRGKIDFADAIRLIERRCTLAQKHLVLRDWAHLDFMGVPFVKQLSYKLTLADVLAPAFNIVHCTLVRHPVDQWLSLRRLEVVQQENFGLAAFLDSYHRFAEHSTRIGFTRYEDFVQNPEQQMKILCNRLQLDFDGNFLLNWATYHKITGDTSKASRGAKLKQIVPLPRPPIRPGLLQQFRRNHSYRKAIKLLSYNDG